MDLKGATLEEKFKNSDFRGANQDEFTQLIVALRNARVNHACQPNASTIYDETAHVAILFAQQDIHPGEEITICYYTPFFGLASYSPSIGSFIPESISIEEELNFFRTLMSSTHGIICPSDCFCYDSAIPALVREGRQIGPTIAKLTNQNRIEEALAAGDTLLDIHRRLNVSLVYRGTTDFNLFRIAVMKSETLPRAKQYIQSAVELFRKICPYSENLTKRMERLLEHLIGAGL